MTSLIIVLIVSWVMCASGPQAVNGVLWNWLLANPGISPGQGNDGSAYARPDTKWLSDDKSSLEGAKSTVRPERHRHGHRGTVLCNDDQICGKGMFCDRHYGACTHLRSEGDHCRKDHHCQRGFDCVFGRCRKHVKKGDQGARCKQDSDCGRNMCCARQHGEYVCKSNLPIGHKCFVPHGGLDYALNEMCPCGAGLVCKNVGKSRPKEEELDWGFWSENDNVRCTAMS